MFKEINIKAQYKLLRAIHFSLVGLPRANIFLKIYLFLFLIGVLSCSQEECFTTDMTKASIMMGGNQTELRRRQQLSVCC